MNTADAGRLLQRTPRIRRMAKWLYVRWRALRGVGYVSRVIERGPLKGYVLYAGKRTPYSQYFWDGSYEIELLELIRRTVRADDVVYDVGANVGYHTLQFAATASSGTVYAFEPLAGARRMLERNVARNGARNVIVVERAVAKQSGEVLLGRTSHYDQAAIDWAGGGNVTVRCPAISLDDFAAAGHAPPTVIKIDVEGAEVEVLLGSRRCLETCRPVVICETHGDEPARKVFDILTGSGYALFKVAGGVHPIRRAGDMPPSMTEGHVLGVHPQADRPVPGIGADPRLPGTP